MGDTGWGDGGVERGVSSPETDEEFGGEAARERASISERFQVELAVKYSLVVVVEELSGIIDEQSST